jgi:hypothetical protein
MKKLIRVYFWIGVNVIGIPELFIHKLKPTTFVENSIFLGEQRTNVYLFNQSLELL